jgi:hypothetical protein
VIREDPEKMEIKALKDQLENRVKKVTRATRVLTAIMERLDLRAKKESRVIQVIRVTLAIRGL